METERKKVRYPKLIWFASFLAGLFATPIVLWLSIYAISSAIDAPCDCDPATADNAGGCTHSCPVPFTIKALVNFIDSSLAVPCLILVTFILLFLSVKLAKNSKPQLWYKVAISGLAPAVSVVLWVMYRLLLALFGVVKGIG